MKRTLLALLLCGLPLAAAQSTIDLDPARTSIGFTLADVLHTVHGSFKLKSGAVKFDPATGAASGAIVIDVSSGDSGSAARDKRMHNQILETGLYPEAIFTPDHVTGTWTPQGESQLDLHGMFQIHGASHEMTFHLHTQVQGSDVVASTSFMIPYVKWGMKNPSTFLLRVGSEVEMNVQAKGRME